MKIELNKKYLITVDNWFIGDDGYQYKSVYGTVTAIEDDAETLGIKTNRGSTNWYVVIGQMVIAGCQIHYCIQTDGVNLNPAVREIEHEGKLISNTEKRSRIYYSDNV